MSDNYYFTESSTFEEWEDYIDFNHGLTECFVCQHPLTTTAEEQRPGPNKMTSFENNCSLCEQPLTKIEPIALNGVVKEAECWDHVAPVADADEGSRKRSYENMASPRDVFSPEGEPHDLSVKKQRIIQDLAHQESISASTSASYSKVYKEPTEFDRLMGAGGGSTTHKGNRRFHDIYKKSLLDAYENAEKGEKKFVAERLVALVENNGGWFLRKDEFGWYRIEAKQAISAASQVLREAVLARKK